MHCLPTVPSTVLCLLVSFVDCCFFVVCIRAAFFLFCFCIVLMLEGILSSDLRGFLAPRVDEHPSSHGNVQMEIFPPL